MKINASDKIVDLTSLKDLSYSSVLRELRKQCSEAEVHQFLAFFKESFDELVLKEEKNPAAKALPVALINFSKKCHLEINND